MIRTLGEWLVPDGWGRLDADIPVSVSVADFGVFPDGTDVTAALQRACDTAGRYQAVLVFPRGQYVVADEVRL